MGIAVTTTHQLEPLRLDARFPLGQMLLSRSVALWVSQDTPAARTVVACMRRHARGDWGELNTEDRRLNDEALIHGGRLLSAYDTGERANPRLWIITEEDRSATTALFPEDY